MTSESSTTRYSLAFLEANRSRQLYVTTTVLLTLCTILLCLRLWARSLTRAGRGWDDLFLFASYVFFVGLCILIYVAIPRAGIGRHLPAVLAEDAHKLATWNLCIYVLDWFYVPSNMLSRVSVVSLYLRVFTSRTARYLCWAVIAFLIGNCLAFVISANLECIPLESLWNEEVEGHCFNIQLWWKLSNVPNVIADVAILLLPLQTIFNLKTKITKKLGIWFVCLTGSIGLVASCARTATFFIALQEEPPDPTWASALLLVWTVVECGMYYCAACLVCLKPLYGQLPKYIRDRWTSIEDSHYPSQKGPFAAPTPRLDKSWRKFGTGADFDSTTNIVEVEAQGEQVALSELSARDRGGHGSGTKWNEISVDTTIEISSAVAGTSNGSGKNK